MGGLTGTQETSWDYAGGAVTALVLAVDEVFASDDLMGDL